MTVKIGDRVGAFRSANETTVKLFGFGVYEGEFRPPGVKEPTLDTVRSIMGDDAVGKTDAELQRFLDALKATPFYSNPRIRLDSGEHVWGYECWWGAEDIMKRRIDGRRVIEAPVIRNEHGRLVEPVIEQEEKAA